MIKTFVDSQWKQVRGQAKEGSSRLSGDPLGQAAGKFDKLSGALQERFGYDRERAERELRRRTAKRQGQPGEDILSALITAHESGDRLSEEELLGTCILLLIAGH